MITFEHVSFSFQNKPIFHDLNLEIAKDDFISLSGGSGIGKTTLLKMVQGYVLPDSGTISINNELLSAKSIHHLRKQISWIPQNINLPVKTGFELIKLMDIEKKADEIAGILENLDLSGDILYEDFSKISGGQKQRIVISIVLGLDKPIVLLDEPTSSLDNKSILKLLNVIKSLKGKTVLTASHNQVWNDHADKVIEL